MKRTNGKRLTLYKETLRRLPRELREPQLAKALGGNLLDCGAQQVKTDTITELLLP